MDECKPLPGMMKPGVYDAGMNSPGITVLSVGQPPTATQSVSQFLHSFPRYLKWRSTLIESEDSSK